MEINKELYEAIYFCIVTEQVPPHRIYKYFQDDGFYEYYRRKLTNK